MSDDENIGRGRPPKSTQFKPGKSGNPKGRPRKAFRLAAPSQVRKDILAVGDMPVPVNTPNGRENMPMNFAIIMSIATQALKGKISAQKMWMALQQASLEERLSTHRQVAVVDALRAIYEDPSSSFHPVDEKMLSGMIKNIKKLY